VTDGTPPGEGVPPEVPADAGVPADAAPPRCAECGSPLDPDQTYCLVCGTPTPLAPRIRRSRAGAWIGAGLVVAGLGAGLLAWAVADDDDARAATATLGTATIATVTAPTTATVATGPLPPDTSIVTTPPPFTTPTDGGTTTPTDFVTTAGPTTAGTGPVDTTGGLPPDGGTTTDETTTSSVIEPPADPESDWPVGTSAWTAVIASASDGTAARDARAEARDRGHGAGILLSDDHAGLTPGLFVVYVGVFADRADAVAQVRRLESDYPGTYPRYISG